MENVYCVVCKQKLPVHDAKVLQTKNKKFRLTGLCPENHKVSKFLSIKEGEGLLGKLLGFPDGKIPVVSDIPIIGNLL